jgi:hypothetical protein
MTQIANALTQQWEFDVLGIYNFRNTNCGNLTMWYKLVKEKVPTMNGCFLEFGVNKGRSFLGTSLLLKESNHELGANQATKNLGFDSFNGFPEVITEFDDPSYFFELYKQGEISERHINLVKKNLAILRVVKGGEINASNVSTSGDFSAASKDSVEAKLKYLELNNSHLYQTDFSDLAELEIPFLSQGIAGVLLDCDLYVSYWRALEFVWTRLNIGGFIYLDEYFSLKFPGARKATNEFFRDKENVEWFHIEIEGFERWWVIKK